MDIIAIIISFFALMASAASACISWRQYYSSEKIGDKFIACLAKNMKELKRTILMMDGGLEDKNRILFIETIHDLMLYQINEKDKLKFLTKEQRDLLSVLQETIEDCVGNIFAKTSAEDVEFNRGVASNAIKEFLKKI